MTTSVCVEVSLARAAKEVCTYVDVIVQVVTNRQIDPISATNHRAAIGATINNLKHVGWANTAAEEDLRRAESASREDYFAGVRRHINCAAVSAFELNTSSMTACADDTPDRRVHHELEVLPCAGRD